MDELKPNAIVCDIYHSGLFVTYTTIQPLRSERGIRAQLWDMDRWQTDPEEKPPYDLEGENVYVILELETINNIELVPDSTEDSILQDGIGLYDTATVIIGTVDGFSLSDKIQIKIESLEIPLLVEKPRRQNAPIAQIGDKIKASGVLDCYINIPISEI